MHDNSLSFRFFSKKISVCSRVMVAGFVMAGLLLCLPDTVSPSLLATMSGSASVAAIAQTLAEVHHFGATGDGITDDSTAIQKAVDSGAPVYLPAYYQGRAQRYLIKHPINCVNRSGPTVFTGDELGEFDQYGPHGSAIIAQTGPRPAFDTSGSQDVEFRDLSIVAMAPNPSTIAILEARSKLNAFAQNHRYQNVNIYLYSDQSANHGRGRIGIYNYGAELWSAYNLHVEADIPLYFSNENDLAIRSEFAPIATGAQSMSAVTIAGESSLIAYGGPAIDLGGSDSGMFDFGQTFIAENATFRGNHSPFVITASGRLRGLRYSGNVENLNQLLLLGGEARGLDLSGSIAPHAGTPLIVLRGNHACSSIADSFLRLRSADPSVLVFLAEGEKDKNCGISGSLVESAAGVKLDPHAIRLQDDIIFGVGTQNRQ